MDYQPVKTDKFFRRRKSKVEKLLCVLLALVILLAIVLGVFLAYTLMKIKPKSCDTPDCIQAANEIIQKMDMSIDPCDDFYEFSCGKFIKDAVIPESKTMVDSFSSISKIIDNQIHAVLDEPMNQNDSKPVKLVKKIYSTCMNETDIELNSQKTIQELLKKCGGWPVVEGTQWNEANFDWVNTLIRLKEQGLNLNVFMEFKADIDNKNSSRRVLTVDQPFVPFENAKRGSRNNKLIDASHTFMVKIAEEFGAQTYLARREMEEIILFEMELVRNMIPAEQRRDLNEEYNPITLRDLERNFPILPWYHFVNKLTSPVKMDYDESLIVYVPEYLRRLQRLMAKTPKRILANYIFYKVVGSLVGHSNKKLRAIQLEFMKATFGIQTPRPRSEQCTSVASRLDVAVGAVYVQKYFDKKSKTHTEEIVRDIEDVFVKTLKNIDWMDDVTRSAALEKLKFMGKFIGYPDELLDNSKLEQHYSELQLASTNYINVILNVSNFQWVEEMKLLKEPVFKTDWRNRASVAVVNAYYDLNGNAIQFPAGILQGVFFNAQRPRYLNYGGIGYIIGHEFTHGFDDEGSQMDENGNLREWWRNETKEAYNKKAECIIEQYSEQIVPEINKTINGINTQGENIADNGGIKLAYLAYQEWATKNGNTEPRLPGLDKFNPNQMFWIGAASAWCSKTKPEELEQEISSEVHPPDRFRINVPFANSKYFAQDFNCPVGSKMNPAQTCTVW